MVSERHWLKFCLESSRLKLLFSMVSLFRSCAASCCTSFSLRSACLDVTCNTDMCQRQVKANTRTGVGPLQILDSNNYWQKNRNWESAVKSWFLNGEITITLLGKLCDCDLFQAEAMALRLLSISTFYERCGGDCNLLSSVAAYRKQQPLHRYWVICLFLYLLTYYFGDIQILLHFN